MMLYVSLASSSPPSGSLPASRVRPHFGKWGAGGIPSGHRTTTRLTLPCYPQEERPPYHRYKKGGSVGGVCYLSMGMVVLLMGLVFASVYIYRYFFLAQVRWAEGGGEKQWPLEEEVNTPPPRWGECPTGLEDSQPPPPPWSWSRGQDWGPIL